MVDWSVASAVVFTHLDAFAGNLLSTALRVAARATARRVDIVTNAGIVWVVDYEKTKALKILSLILVEAAGGALLADRGKKRGHVELVLD